MFQMDDMRTATLDLKNRKKRPAANTPVPFADVEDDQNLTPADSSMYNNGQDPNISLLSGAGAASTPYSTYGSRSPYATSSTPAKPQHVGHEGPYGKMSPGAVDADVLPPYQEDHWAQHGVEGIPPGEVNWSPYTMTTTPTGRMWTRTFTSPDGTVITEIKTEKDGVVETRIEKRVVLTGNASDFDHDKALADAIRRVTDMNPDLAVEKIEIQSTTERRE